MFDDEAARDHIIRSLSRHAGIGDADRAAIAALPLVHREIAASAYIVREGQQPRRCGFLLEGFTYRQKLTLGGGRSIVSIQVPGDFIDLQNLFLDESDHDLLALTAIVVAEAAIDDLRALVATRPAIGKALWKAGLIEASIHREWMLNVGRRDAQARLAHLLCETSARLEAAGIARDQTYELPMTQEQLGDALGLTSVHVNRVMKVLEREGLIRRRKREVAIADWQRLRRVAEFNERYLHLATKRLEAGRRVERAM